MMKDAENEVQNITNEFSNKIDEFLSVKEKDIMTV
jgi:ribosome recycling factor